MAVVAAALLVCPAAGQMPDWIGIRDKEGNRYFIDPAGKVRTLGEPLKTHRAVNASGIEYYITHAEDLLRYHHKFEGLLILKSILAMPVESSMVLKAQRKASALINSLYLRDGSRFEALSREASLLLYKSGDYTFVLDDYMRFSLKVKGTVEVIRKKAKTAGAYEYRGLMLGLRFGNGDEKGQVYDSLMAVDAEKYISAADSIDLIMQHWELSAGQGDVARTIVLKKSDRVINEFTLTGKVPLKGLEGMFASGKRGYFFKLIAPAGGYSAVKGSMMDTAQSFAVVGD